jgi:hypothetical protein
MHRTKLTAVLLLAGLSLTWGVAQAADADPAAPEAPKPAARPTTLPPPSTKQGITYDTDIKPLLQASCVRCHEGSRAKAELHLDSLKGILDGSENGKVITPGNSEQSKLVRAIARINPKTAMPPEPRPRRGPRPDGPGAPGGNTNQPNSEAKPGPAHDGPPPAAGMAEHEEADERPPSGPGGPGREGRRPQGPPAKPLTAEEVGLVRAWIDQGAK